MLRRFSRLLSSVARPCRPLPPVVALLMALPLLVACGSDSLKPEPHVNDSTLYTVLELDHHAVALSLSAAGTYDTLRLVAIPRNYRGEPLAGLPGAQYASRDPEKVAVTAEGLLVARAPTAQPVWVVATLTTENLKHQDSAVVQVVATDTPPVLASFSVHPVPPDSAKHAAEGNAPGDPVRLPPRFLPVQAADPNGNPIPDLPVSFRSSDTTIARIGATDGRIRGHRPGTVTFTANTTAFGVTKADTLPYRIGLPVFSVVRIGQSSLGQQPGSFLDPDYVVGTGVTIVWSPSTLLLVFNGLPGGVVPETDITFVEADLPNIAAPNLASDLIPSRLDAKPACFVGASDCRTGGNILMSGGVLQVSTPPFPVAFAMRTFPVPGTYEYRSTIHGTSGRIVVVDER